MTKAEARKMAHNAPHNRHAVGLSALMRLLGGNCQGFLDT